MSSRYGSYTTLPRPEHVEIEDLQQQRFYPQKQQNAKIPNYGANFYDKNIYGPTMGIKVKFYYQ